MDAQPGPASLDAVRVSPITFRALANEAEHLYGYAMRGMAEDWAAGGPTRSACRGYETAPRSAMIQCTGRHTGDLMGIPPTNREIVQDYVHILRF